PATTPTLTPTPTPTPTSSRLTACPAAAAFSTLPVFARGLGAPDDLLALADGTLWVSDPVHGTLRHLASGDRALDTIFDPDAPEGIALLPDGRLVVAEQRLNRIVTLRPPARARTILFELPSGAAEGVDGIAYDVHGARLLVPDSPHGTLVEWPLSGDGPRTIARDLGRGVGVAVGSDGAIYVVAEASAGLLRISSGRGEPVGTIAQADDIVAANGL